MEQRIERLEQTTTRYDEQIATLFSKVDDVNSPVYPTKLYK